MFFRSDGLRQPAVLTDPKPVPELAAVPRPLTGVVAIALIALSALMYTGGVRNADSYLGGLMAVSSLIWIVSGGTGVYAALTGRRTWMRLRHRRTSGLILLGVSVGFFILAVFLLSAAS